LQAVAAEWKWNYRVRPHTSLNIHTTLWGLNGILVWSLVGNDLVLERDHRSLPFVSNSRFSFSISQNSSDAMFSPSCAAAKCMAVQVTGERCAHQQKIAGGDITDCHYTSAMSVGKLTYRTELCGCTVARHSHERFAIVLLTP